MREPRTWRGVVHLFPSKTHEPSSTNFFLPPVLPFSGETNADTRVAPNIDS